MIKLTEKYLFVLFVSLILLNTLALGQSDLKGVAGILVGYNPLNQLYLEGDLEFNKLLSKNEDPWSNFDFNLFIAYYPARLIDLTVEIANGKTKQTSELSSYEATQRLGARWYILQRGHNLFKLSAGIEGAPQRFEFSNFIRFEHRNFDYYGEKDPEQEWRFRNRTQFIVILNKKTFNENRALSFLSDFEFFIPFGTDITERFATQLRFRLGPSYRHSYRWRFDLFYILDKSRDEINDQFKVSSHKIKLKLKLFF